MLSSVARVTANEYTAAKTENRAKGQDDSNPLLYMCIGFGVFVLFMFLYGQFNSRT